MFRATLEPDPSRGYFPGHTLVNRYELVRLLREGGTGVVWVARDRVLNLEVALKLIQRSGAASDDFAERAQLEARSAARLAHPAVCRAMDFGLSEYGEPFVVSELLSGESLDDTILRESWLEATHAVRILLPILDALSAAHECGIVHRDVKPANIFLAREGLQRIQPKLLDFGIARSLEDARATNEVGICGTPEYMSPEQARGCDDIDARSDVWSFCVTLYELLTGVVPFRGNDVQAVLCAIQCVDPEPITNFGVGDARLSRIVLRGLSRNRDERWLSARELGEELCQWLLARGVETDICDHSLRARLDDRSEADGGQETSYAQYAHVVPRGEAAPSSVGVGRGEGAGARSPWRWPLLAAAAATVLVTGASFLQALRADVPPFEPAVAQAAVAPTPAKATEPPSVTVASQESPAAPTPGPPRAEATPGDRAPAASGAPAPRIRRGESAKRPAAAPAAAHQPARKRSKNALNYDFGF